MKINEIKPKLNNQGFTLVEVVLAMAILGLVFVPLMQYFSESLKHSALAARRQQATMMAQQITEQLKAGDALITKGDSGYAVNTKYVYDSSTNPSGFVLSDNTIDASSGKGKVKLSKSVKDFDVVVELDTDLSLNAVKQTIVYGIDDSKDLLAVEREQQTQALFYFMAINNSYVAEQLIADPTASLTPLTALEVENLMTRTIHMSIDKEVDSSVTPSKTYYLLKVYYEYSCENLRVDKDGNNELDESGNPIVDTIESDYLLDAKTDKFTNVYLLYDRMVERDSDGTVTQMKKDTMYVDMDSSINVSECDMVLCLICQNLSEGTSFQSAYTFDIKAPDTLGAGRIAGNSKLTSARSNIMTKYVDKSGVETNTGIITNSTVSGFDTKPLTDQGELIRLVNMTVSVYKSGHTSTDAPFTVLNTTKGE